MKWTHGISRCSILLHLASCNYHYCRFIFAIASVGYIANRFLRNRMLCLHPLLAVYLFDAAILSVKCSLHVARVVVVVKLVNKSEFLT